MAHTQLTDRQTVAEVPLTGLEPLLALFTAVALACLGWWMTSPSRLAAVCGGLALGLMAATKETFAIVAGSWLIGLLVSGSQKNLRQLGMAAAFWTTSLEVDATGNPVGIFTTRANDSDLDHRFFYSRFDGREWHVNEIAKAGGYLYAAENDYTGLASIDPDNPNVVYLSTKIDPRTQAGTAKYELYKGFTADFGGSWAEPVLAPRSGRSS